MSNFEKEAIGKGLVTGLAGLGAGAAGMAGYSAMKPDAPIEEHPDYKPPVVPEEKPKDYFDQGMDSLEENVYNPAWNFISEQSQNPGTRKLLTALALIALLGGGTYFAGKNQGKKDILNRFQ